MTVQRWATVEQALPRHPFGGGPEEGALHEAFAEFVGGEHRARMLQECWRRAGQAVAGQEFRLHGPRRTQARVFGELASREGFNGEHVKAFRAL